MLHLVKGFKEEELSPEQIRCLRAISHEVRADVLKMIRLAEAGNAAGSLSSVDIFVTLLASINLRPEILGDAKRDRIVVSHGHTSPALYASLGRFDFFDLDDAIALFCKSGSVFEGNLDRSVPGVEWGSGNLGLGLSVASGLGLACKLKNQKFNVFLVMSDAEQQKGEIAEARRFAKKYRLNNITAIIDCNTVQAVGRTADVMPQNLKYEYIADGWDVIEINGHDHNELYKALRRASQIQSAPVLILAHTTIGKGVSFIESDPIYPWVKHSQEEYIEAMKELRVSSDLTELADYREAFTAFELELAEEEFEAPTPNVGKPTTYKSGQSLSNIEAFGKFLVDVGELNKENEKNPIAVIDANTAETSGSMKFGKENRASFFEFGVQDHSAATTAGALSMEGVSTVWASPGVFSLEAAYNQLKMIDLNRCHLKLAATHLGLDHAHEGKSLQCIDYIGLVNNLLGFNAVFPADPNQADRVLRYVLRQPGNWVVGLSSRKTPIVTDLDGSPYYAGKYQFEYGLTELIRPGDHGVILTSGAMLENALKAWDKLKEMGREPSVLHVPCPKALETSEDPTLLNCLRMGRVITYEDHNVNTGLGSIVANFIATRGISCRLLKLGVARYGFSGSYDEILKKLGLDVDELVARAYKLLKK